MLLKVEKTMSGQKVCKGESMKTRTSKGMIRESYEHLGKLGNSVFRKNFRVLVRKGQSKLLALLFGGARVRVTDHVRTVSSELRADARSVSGGGRCVLLRRACSRVVVAAWLRGGARSFAVALIDRPAAFACSLAKCEKRTSPCSFPILRGSKHTKNAPKEYTKVRKTTESIARQKAEWLSHSSLQSGWLSNGDKRDKRYPRHAP